MVIGGGFVGQQNKVRLGHRGAARRYPRQLRRVKPLDFGSTERRTLLTAFRTHPFPIMRAKHLDEWVSSGGFTKLTGIEL